MQIDIFFLHELYRKKTFLQFFLFFFYILLYQNVIENMNNKIDKRRV